MTKWISVKDKLPERKMWVLLYTKQGIIRTGCLCDEMQGICNDFHLVSECYCPDEILNVSHWMPLPDAPKEKE